MAKVIRANMARVAPEAEEKFNRWYNETHIPMLMECKTLRKVTRYKRVTPGEKYPEYMVIYEFDNLEGFERYSKGPEFAATVKELGESWPGQGMERGFEMEWRLEFEEIKSWEQ
ncbi:DUF4286 family protein [Chloroflexota bacterium]